MLQCVCGTTVSFGMVPSAFHPSFRHHSVSQPCRCLRPVLEFVIALDCCEPPPSANNPDPAAPPSTPLPHSLHPPQPASPASRVTPPPAHPPHPHPHPPGVSPSKCSASCCARRARRASSSRWSSPRGRARGGRGRRGWAMRGPPCWSQRSVSAGTRFSAAVQQQCKYCSTCWPVVAFSVPRPDLVFHSS